MEIAITPANQTIPKGATLKLTATGTYSDRTTQPLDAVVTWHTTQAAVAAIDTEGMVTGVSQGVAQMSATYQGVTGNAAVTVGQPALVSVALSPNPSSLPLGESEQLTATGSYSDGSSQDLTQSAAWSSTGSASAGNSPGLITGMSVGAGQVLAVYLGVTGNASVTVGQAALVSIAVTPIQSSLPLGESEPLQAMGTFSDGSSQDLTQTATWTSSATATVSVNAQGIVTGAGMGVAQLSAASQGVTGSASVTVEKPAMLNITVTPNPSTLPVGESEQLQAVGTFSDGTTQNLTQSAAWSSSGPTVATVNPTGTVLAKAVGTVAITAATGSLTGSATLTVAPPAMIALNIVPSNFLMVLESSRQLQAIGTLSDGTTQNMTMSVAWSSAQPHIASVSSGGLATANQIGSTTIVAEGGNLTASANLTVTPRLLLNYFNLANAEKSGEDGTIWLTNPGITDMCAMIYVFDSSQEMNECCGCAISENGMRTLSLINDLTANVLTGKKPVAGIIEVVPSDVGPNGQCNAGAPTPDSALEAWGTNVQAANNDYQATEEDFALAPLTNTQATVLATECAMMQKLGSGRGICSCGTGD